MASYHDVDATFRPIGVWPGQSTAERRSSPFSASWSSTLELLKRELRALDAQNIVIQLDIEERDLRLDGYPRANARAKSPGVILAFDSKYGPLRYPCDTFTHWEDNLRGIALAMEALRKVDRYGVTKRGEQYTGWKALPAGGETSTTMTAEAASRVIADLAYRSGRGPHPYVAAQRILDDPAAARDRYREAALYAHPDHGGSNKDFQLLQEAKQIIDNHHGKARP